jgi:hypothetical protein
VLNVEGINRTEDSEMARRASSLTHERVLELFNYNAETGDLIWKGSYSNRIKDGDVAGCVASNGRRYTGVDGNTYMVHRLVWLHQKGAWPQFNLAPIDGDHLNTRIENLVEQTPSQTIKKNELRSTNKTGIKGVTWDEAKKEFAVYAYIDGKSIFHSRHKSIEDAKRAAAEAAIGIIPTAEQRKAHHDRKIERKRLWPRMIKWCKGLHRWESIDRFLDEVGDPPHSESRLVPADPEKTLGPGNFMWTEVGVDHRSDEARRAAEKREANREQYRDGHLKRKFGPDFGHTVYVQKLLEQKGVCAICEKPETTTDFNGRVREFHVDHDHETGDVRGLLCGACNTAIGQMQEDVARLQSAIRYIEHWNDVKAAEKKASDNVIPINSSLGFGA